MKILALEIWPHLLRGFTPDQEQPAFALIRQHCASFDEAAAALVAGYTAEGYTITSREFAADGMEILPEPPAQTQTELPTEPPAELPTEEPPPAQ